MAPSSGGAGKPQQHESCAGSNATGDVRCSIRNGVNSGRDPNVLGVNRSDGTGAARIR